MTTAPTFNQTMHALARTIERVVLRHGFPAPVPSAANDNSIGRAA